MPKKYKGGGKDFLSKPINIVILIIYTILVSLLYYYDPWNLLEKQGGLILSGAIMLLFFMVTTMVFKSSGIVDVGDEGIWAALKQYGKAWGNIGLFFAVLFGIGLFFYFIAWLFSGSAATFVFYKVIKG